MNHTTSNRVNKQAQDEPAKDSVPPLMRSAQTELPVPINVSSRTLNKPSISTPLYALRISAMATDDAMETEDPRTERSLVERVQVTHVGLTIDMHCNDMITELRS
jgi:hypothetical protein